MPRKRKAQRPQDDGRAARLARALVNKVVLVLVVAAAMTAGRPRAFAENPLPAQPPRPTPPARSTTPTTTPPASPTQPTLTTPRGPNAQPAGSAASANTNPSTSTSKSTSTSQPAPTGSEPTAAPNAHATTPAQDARPPLITRPVPAPFGNFQLPDAWVARFWAEPGTKALLLLDAKALAALVPTQAGLRYCRCPKCDATEDDDTLAWSPRKPNVVTCTRCGVSVPNDEFPASVDGAVPEEGVEVLPGVLHKYPYHLVDPLHERYPGERLYLAAKRDYEAREALSKAALYAAMRYREQPAAKKDPALARMACVILLRFAQVYPAYAVHYDQPGRPKYLDKADLPPPYRAGYQSGKWDSLGCLDVPLNLVIAYALVRDLPALIEAGRALGDLHPARTIEQNLFRASAQFVAQQPEEFQEDSLLAYRGLLAVGRLLSDEGIFNDAIARLRAFTERAFYHDGLWRQGDPAAHRRVVAQLDGWIDQLLTGTNVQIPILALAREAGSAPLTDPRSPEIQQTAWPAPVAASTRSLERRPLLLGGAGLVRLAIGQGAEALDVEIKGLGGLGTPRFNSQALRLSVGGRPVLGDLDDLPPSTSGWERATASHNTIVVDGLNQRETPARARTPSPGADILFFAADPDFQVATLADRYSYPVSTTRYRQTVIASAGPHHRYAVSVFEVQGGLQHDQFFHGAAGSNAQWRTSVPVKAGPSTLLPESISYLPTAHADDGRWFVQAYGEFTHVANARFDDPAQAWLAGPGGVGVRLHLLDRGPLTLFTAHSTDPLAASENEADGRSALILRRRSEEGATLNSTFVTVFEPIGPTVSLVRVGRVAASGDVVVLYLETPDGPEHLVVNLKPGTKQTVTLADGQRLRTDGLAVRASARDFVLAGGTFAETGGKRVKLESANGTILRAEREALQGTGGWFETERPLENPQDVAGRAILIHHGDGTVRGWTIARAENTSDGHTRIWVREEPGFRIDPHTGEAHDYQFPRRSAPGPHHFRVAQIARTQ